MNKYKVQGIVDTLIRQTGLKRCHYCHQPLMTRREIELYVCEHGEWGWKPNPSHLDVMVEGMSSPFKAHSLKGHDSIEVTGVFLATIDHKTPTSKGGTDAYENLVLSCFSCNCKKQARFTYEEFMKLTSHLREGNHG